VNSFASVSLDPPLVLWSLARKAQSYAAFASCSEFAINVLALGQHDLARRFSVSGGEKFEGLEVDRSLTGVPLLRGTAARLVCQPHAVFEGGDHVIVVGRVTHHAKEHAPPLIFMDGKMQGGGERVDACLIAVGSELLSGTTIDVNGPYIARRLKDLGINLREVRVVGDSVEAVAAAVRSTAARRRWVFVTGGLGPTHDDVTASGIAAAFGVPIEEHPDAIRSLREYHEPAEIPAGRLPAARLPRGCVVLPDSISGAAGFRLHNVFALPGVPDIAQHLFERAAAELPRGVPLHETSIRAALMESDVAAELRELQVRHPTVQIGCYPYFGDSQPNVTLILRSPGAAALARCEADLRAVLAGASARRKAATMNGRIEEGVT
jgi:molybdenum cofactor synthesis domain-containing protein